MQTAKEVDLAVLSVYYFRLQTPHEERKQNYVYKQKMLCAHYQLSHRGDNSGRNNGGTGNAQHKRYEKPARIQYDQKRRGLVGKYRQYQEHA